MPNPEMARGAQGAPAAPVPSPGRGGRGAGLPSLPRPNPRAPRAAHPERDEGGWGSVSAEVQGLLSPAPGQPGQTPDTHLREDSGSRRDRQSPPLRSRARRPRRERGSRPAQGPKRNNVPARGGGLGRVPRPGIPKPSGVPDRGPGGSPCSPAAPRAERPDACAPQGRSTCALPARVDRRAPTFAGSPGRASRSLGGGGRRRHHLRRAAAAPGRAPEARGALDPESAAPPAAATSKRGGGAGAPRAAAAAATGAAAHDSVTRGIRQSVTWTPGPCRRRSSGTNRSLRAPRLAGSQPMGRARASM